MPSRPTSKSSREILEKIAHEKDVAIHDCLVFPVFVLCSLPKDPLALCPNCQSFVDVRNLERRTSSRNRARGCGACGRRVVIHPPSKVCVYELRRSCVATHSHQDMLTTVRGGLSERE
ncbi:Protein kinase domain-containing protein [Psidium guajava]|nr:Protein kinase domain-containing protein [Psidium guajava]